MKRISLPGLRSGRVMSAIGGGIIAIALLLSCSASSAPADGGCDQNCDLQNMPARYPDWFQMFMDVHGMPTIGVMCVGGGGIMVTTRQNTPAAAQVYPAIDAFCKTQVGSRFSVTGKASDEPRYARVP